MQNFVHKLEHFSIEVFLEIFDYLSITDCFNAFYNLNGKINGAFSVTGLSIDLTAISRQTFNEFYQKLIFSRYTRQIRKLKISNDLTIGLIDTFFNRFSLQDFEQLRSLTLIKPSYMKLGSLALLVPHLKQLEHVSIDSTSYPESFFQAITTKSPSIKSCYLPGLEIQEELSFQSNILHLTITVEDITILLNLLAVFPQLKYLHVFLRSTIYIDEASLPTLNLISCRNLQFFKLQILERSSLDFSEIEYLFQQTSFNHLKSFSYHCTTSSLDHIDVTRWNEILSEYLSTIDTFHFFVQIPYNSYSYIDIKQNLHDLQTNLYYSFPLSLSINYLYYIIHSNIYPKTHFDLSFKSSNSDQYFNYDPISCENEMKYSKVNSLVVDSNSISTCTILPATIQYLHLQGENENLNLCQCLQHCSNQLISLKICGLPHDLPRLSNLRQLTIQHVMFNRNMVSQLSLLCPRLELLTIEIDSMELFGDILDQLRDKTQFTNLKFLRVFSRDTTNQTWSSWLHQTQPLLANNNAIYEAKHLFLFIWF